jgi:heme/copper-type cytochrome/quinol oxidase subunit 2
MRALVLASATASSLGLCALLACGDPPPPEAGDAPAAIAPASPAEPVTPRAMEIEIEARQWTWSVHYPQLGTRLQSDGDPERTVMVVPKGRPVRLRATSKDVLHTLYVPAFRVKLDVIPGRESEVMIEATEVGRYSLACVEVCGKGHESMRAMIEVVEPAAMDPALEKAEASAAAAVLAMKSCSVTARVIDGATARGKGSGTRSADASAAARAMACAEVERRAPGACGDATRTHDVSSRTSVHIENGKVSADAEVVIALSRTIEREGRGIDREHACTAAREAACTAAGVAKCTGADFEIVAVDGVAIGRVPASPP